MAQCKGCKGDGKCSKCNGAGTHMSGFGTCKKCDGSGNCTVCQGSGTQPK